MPDLSLAPRREQCGPRGALLDIDRPLSSILLGLPLSSSEQVPRTQCVTALGSVRRFSAMGTGTFYGEKNEKS